MKKVLIVDDNIDILDLFEIFLYKEYEVHTATNGFDGLSKAREVNPDCVVADIMMPVMDGMKFINRFRKIEGFEEIPVIAATAFTANLQEKSLRNVGFSAVVAKPVSRKLLLETIENLISAQSET